MNLVGRIKDIVLKPKLEWHIIAREPSTIAELYKTYIVILAALGPVASVIGLSIIGANMPGVGTIKIPITTAIASAILQYGLTLAAVYVLALIINALAPTFSGEKNINQAFKLAAYSYTPGWLAGIFMMIPALGFLGIFGLYGLYMLYLGLPVLMKSPGEKSAGYTVAIIIAAIVLFAVIAMISRSIFTFPRPGMTMSGM
ncbi:MAG: YIP1 family protein [Nitrospirae bacterium]|nr:YIP1 family protein [Nitrospirota bacterium]